MKDEMKAALETAMDEFDKRRSEATKRREAMKAKESEFSRMVERLFKEVIRPAMERVKQTLGERRHDCTISEDKQSVTSDLRDHPAHISLTIKLAPPTGGGYTLTIARTISFAAVQQEGKILVVSTTSSLPIRQVDAGVRGSYEPSRLTPKEVEQELVAFVRAVLT